MTGAALALEPKPGIQEQRKPQLIGGRLPIGMGASPGSIEQEACGPLPFVAQLARPRHPGRHHGASIGQGAQLGSIGQGEGFREQVIPAGAPMVALGLIYAGLPIAATL